MTKHVRIILRGGPRDGIRQDFPLGAPKVIAIPELTDADGNAIRADDYVEGESKSVVHFYRKFTRITYRYVGTYAGRDSLDQEEEE